MENYSSDTVERVRQWFQEWDGAAKDFDTRREGCRRVAAQTCDGSRNPTACADAQRERCNAALHASDGDRPPHPKLYLIHVRFEAIPDETVKRRLQGIGTRLQLSTEEVELLIEWARRLLKDSDTYQELVRELNASSPA